MTEQDLEAIKREILQEFEAKTPKSRRLFEEAKEYLPGGGTRNIAYYPPYPFYIDRGEGFYLYDVDGNQYLDVQNNMTVLLHGNAHPKILEAIWEQAKKGTVHSAPLEVQTELAKILCERIPSVESIRFCNSGTEATMFAMRAARAFTNKRGIIKAEGGYHGSHDYAMVNMDPDLTAEWMPNVIPERGISETLKKDVFVVPFNDLVAVEKVMKKHHKEIAALIFEPVMGYGGAATATEEYMKGLRDLCTKYNILLIFDEVITFRLSTGGMQKRVGIKPDLTALGKTIGGGFPIGAFGGRADIMEIFSPIKKGYVMHSGTFSGNPMSMVAGITALKMYDQEAVDRLEVLGKRLINGLKQIAEEFGIKCNVGGVQSLVFIQFPDKIPMTKKEVVFNTIPFLEFSQFLQVTMALNGLYVITRGVTGFMLSTIMDEAFIDDVLERFKKSVERVLPLYEDAKNYPGFSGIIHALLKQLNRNVEFSQKFALDDYSILLAAKDDDTAIKLVVKDGTIDFIPIPNTPENIQQAKTECSGAIITTKPGFFGIVLKKASPLILILKGKLKIKGLKCIKRFTQYFGLLKGM